MVIVLTAPQLLCLARAALIWDLKVRCGAVRGWRLLQYSGWLQYRSCTAASAPLQRAPAK